MKILKTHAKILILAILVFSSFNVFPVVNAMPDEGGGGGGGTTYKYYTVKGYVRDLASNPIVGAAITISGAASGTTTTGSTGYYQKTLMIANGPSSAAFTITAGNSGFFYSSGAVNVVSGSNSQLDLTLYTSLAATIHIPQVYLVTDSSLGNIVIELPNHQTVSLGNIANSIIYAINVDVTFSTTVYANSPQLNFQMRSESGILLWSGYLTIESRGSSQGWAPYGIGVVDIGVASITTTFTKSYTVQGAPCSPTTCLPSTSTYNDYLKFEVQTS